MWVTIEKEYDGKLLVARVYAEVPQREGYAIERITFGSVVMSAFDIDKLCESDPDLYEFIMDETEAAVENEIAIANDERYAAIVDGRKS